MIIFFPVTFVYRRSLATLAVSREGGGGEGEGLLQEVYQNSLLPELIFGATGATGGRVIFFVSCVNL